MLISAHHEPSRAAGAADRGHSLVWALLALGLFLRAFRLTHQSLWADEVESLYRSWGHSLPQFLERTASDYHPPLFYLLLWLWRGFGESDWVARSLAALVGAAFLPVAYTLGRRLGGPRVGAWALALAAFSPLHLWYSQEVRQYGLLVLLAGISWVLFLRALERPSALRWAALGVVFAAGLLTHVYFAFVPLAQAPLLWLDATRGVAGAESGGRGGSDGLRRRLLPWLATHAAAALVLLPVLVWKIRAITGWSGELGELASALAGMRGLGTGNIGGFSLLALPYTFFAWSAGYSLGPPLWSLHLSGAERLLEWGPEIALVGILFGGTVILGLGSLRREPLARRALLAGIAVPLAGALAVIAASDVAYHPRYALAAFPLYLVLLGRGLTVLGGSRGAILGGALLAVSALADLNHFANSAYAKEDARMVVRYVGRHARPGDVVVVDSYLRPYTYYLRPPDPVDVGMEGEDPWFPLYEKEGLRLVPLREAYATATGARAFWDLIPEPKPRVWLVESPRWRIDPEGDLRRFLAEGYRTVESRAFPQVELRLLERR